MEPTVTTDAVTAEIQALVGSARMVGGGQGYDFGEEGCAGGACGAKSGEGQACCPAAGSARPGAHSPLIVQPVTPLLDVLPPLAAGGQLPLE